MDDRYSTQKLLALRKLTRAVADYLRGQIREYLSTFAPLLRPVSLFGEYVQGGLRERSSRAERAFQDLQQLYATVASAKPFGLPKELHPPLELQGAALEITPVEYMHAVKAEGNIEAGRCHLAPEVDSERVRLRAGAARTTHLWAKVH